MRQRSSRYAIRAGRNLPDKEFRYLRTVIVTAAVYWGFDQELLLPSHITYLLRYASLIRSSHTYVCSGLIRLHASNLNNI